MFVAMTRRPSARLTERELEVLELLFRGLTPKEIAARLDVSHWTVRAHIANARNRTNSRTNEQLIARVRHRFPRSADRAPV